MSTFLFHSSPPRSSQFDYQVFPTSFFTPQVHGSRILGWPQSFSSTSSVLHTSKNANIMRSPTKPVKHVRFQDGHEDNDVSMQEDSPSLPSYTIPTTMDATTAQDGQPALAQSSFTQQTSIFQPSLQLSSTSDDKPTFFLSTTSQSQSHPRSRFQQRSRDMSSTAMLSNSIANARATRQSGSRFLDRLRQTRHDRRDRRGAETVEQIDFFHEQRKRAAYFEREAQSEELDAEIDLDLGYDEQLQMFEDEEAELSPTEDKEVEDLVRSYYEPSGMDTGTIADSPQHGRDADSWPEDEESEYDRLFMELLSQEQNSAGSTDTSNGGLNNFRAMNDGVNTSDQDTEMS